MNIQLDRKYKITFKGADEASIDFTPFNGFYEVVRAYGWQELTNAEIDLKEELLTPLGVDDESVFRSLQSSWVNAIFYLCYGLDADRTLWVPDTIIKGYPDPNVGNYKKLSLIVDLGVFANPEDYKTLTKDIMNYLRVNMGIDRPEPILSSYDSVWMSNTDYDMTEVRRNHSASLMHTYLPYVLSGTVTITDITIPFGTPQLNVNNVVTGGLSDSIQVIIPETGILIPEGTATTLTSCWYYAADQVDTAATAIEKTLDTNFVHKVINGIHIRHKFSSNTPIQIWYRTRNNKVNGNCAYGSALSYAYENLALRKKCSDLLDIIKSLQPS